jgi:oligosaccharide repeat unit polymerase
MAFAFIIWAILFLFSPLVVNIELNGTAYVFLFCCILSFILGVALVKDKIGFRTSKSANNLRRLFFLILYLAILGLALKLTDRFIIRGISSSSNYFENREIMEAAGGNYIAILSSFLTPLGIIPIFLLWKHKISTNWIVKIIAFILFFAQIFDAVLLGSRSIIFVLFILLGLYLFYFQKIKITLLKGLGIVMVILSFMLMMNFIFVERTKIFAGENTYDLVLNQSNINYTVTSSNSFKNTFSNLNPTTQSLVFTYLTTTQYFTHGMIILLLFIRVFCIK